MASAFLEGVDQPPRQWGVKIVGYLDLVFQHAEPHLLPRWGNGAESGYRLALGSTCHESRQKKPLRGGALRSTESNQRQVAGMYRDGVPTQDQVIVPVAVL